MKPSNSTARSSAVHGIAIALGGFILVPCVAPLIASIADKVPALLKQQEYQTACIAKWVGFGQERCRAERCGMVDFGPSSCTFHPERTKF